MRAALTILIVAPLLVGTLPVAGPARLDEPPAVLGRYLVRFEDTVRNETDEVLRDVRCRALLPEDGPGQRVEWLRLSPHGWTLSRDGEGQWTGLAECAELAPGAAVTFGWLAAVELRRRPDADPRQAPGPGALADGPMLGLGTPELVAAAREVRASADSAAPADLAAAAHAYVAAHVEYALDGGWLPAPEVLRAERGSCSEMTFVFLALCRRLGIPARSVGGTLPRGGMPGRAVDASFHRIAEAWLPGRGWVAFETTADADALPERMLVLSRTVGDAGASGLYYHARNEWRGSAPGVRPRVSKRAYWVDASESVPPGGDPLRGLVPGHRASFARCEILLAESEGYGPSISPGRLGSSPARRVPPRRSAGECRVALVASGHPGALRVSHRLAGGGGIEYLFELDAMQRACQDDLEREFVPLLAASRAEFEEWWAGASRRVTPHSPGHLTVVTRTR